MNRHVFSVELIEKMLKDSDWKIRLAAMNACQGREIPLEIIQQGLKDSDWNVRVAAMNFCKSNNIHIPVIRTDEDFPHYNSGWHGKRPVPLFRLHQN